MHSKLFPCFSPKLIVFDFDGVFTDNTVYIDENGIESVRCCRDDGLGIDMLRKEKYAMLILSTETNPVVAARGRKLQIPVIQGCRNKKKYLAEHLEKERIDPAHVVYIGDDINDLEAMAFVGWGVCPANAHPCVKKIANCILENCGGHGAVREFCEILLAYH